jgi:hypothetical protein
MVRARRGLVRRRSVGIVRSPWSLESVGVQGRGKRMSAVNWRGQGAAARAEVEEGTYGDETAEERDEGQAVERW